VSTTVCLTANTIDYPEGGGHFWVHLNWALGLRALDCQVLWLEPISPDVPVDKALGMVAAQRDRLRHYELDGSLALCSTTDQPLPPGLTAACLDSAAAADQADLLLDLRYDLPAAVVGSFRRTALLDIDPGELQFWLDLGEINPAPHDVYFTIGETVGRPGAKFPDAGLPWVYTPPCVALNWWPPRRGPSEAPFTTVAHWYDGWMGDPENGYVNGKRSGFLPFLDLPRQTGLPLELALDLTADDEDQMLLWDKGWVVREAAAVAATPWDYQRYVQQSRGEFSCAKPHCVRMENAWVSDRTLCYLASGKPAVVEHTGPSRFLPDAAGLFRFRDPAEAARCLEAAATDYDRHCRLARALAEEFFDARRVVRKLLERAVD
jgi:hypothetical protein